MTELEIQSFLDKWWSSKRVEIKDYIDSRLGVAKARGTVFAPPTIDEVVEYVKSDGYMFKEDMTPHKFIDFYTAKGWMIGKNKMKDWKAALRQHFVVKGTEKKKFSPPRCKCGRILNSGEKQVGMCLTCEYQEKLEKERTGQ